MPRQAFLFFFFLFLSATTSAEVREYNLTISQQQINITGKPVPAMTINAIGYGAGTRELDSQANVVRLIVGTTPESQQADQVWVLETNIDDVAGEVIGHCTTLLAESGALDVYTTAIQMKKNRPATKISVLCQAGDIARLEKVLFRETATLGIRRWPTLLAWWATAR